MATGGSDLMSDEIKSIKCCICLQENRKTDADKYCTDCKDYYCTPCVGIHRKVGIMRGHKIEDKAANNSTRSDRSLPCYPTQRCFQHPLEVISAYCKYHDEVACAICMCNSNLHRSCGNILSIPQSIDDLYGKYNLNDIQQNISHTKTAMENIKKIKENQFEELKKAVNTDVDAVKAFRKELEALLVDMEKDTIKELKTEFSRIEASFTTEINTIESLLEILNETASQLNKADGNKAQEFVCVKISKKMLGNADKLQKHVDEYEKVFLTPDDRIKSFLQQIKSLGKVQTFTLSLYKVKKQTDISVKLNNDRTNCGIWGSCITEDGYLLLADVFNEKLKRMDLSTEKVVDDIKLQCFPRGVCSVSRTEAAVALDNNSIQFVSLGDKMATTGTLTMNHPCFGLAHKDGKLFISDDSNSVYIYDINGQQQHKLTLNEPRSHLHTGWAPYYAVCANGNRIFVAHHKQGLVVLDSQGKHLFSQCYNNESDYRGVCTDGTNIFVSMRSSKKIVQIGPDFKMLGNIVTVPKNTTLCFDFNQTRLIATVESSNYIKVLQLE